MAANMITSTTWVPRGFTAQHPRRLDVDGAELERITEMAKLQLEDAKQDLEDVHCQTLDSLTVGNNNKIHAASELRRNGTENREKQRKTKNAEGDDLKEYNMHNYDDDFNKFRVVRSNGQPIDIFGGIENLVYYPPGENDPYITVDDDADEEEREELQVLPTDNLLLVGRFEDDIPRLEVYIYEDEADNLYVHHDMMLPAIPLCLEWLNVSAGAALSDKCGRGNFVAIGTTLPDIEIWNLDIVDCMLPDAILGAGAIKAPRKKKRTNEAYHVEAVQALAGNRAHRNILASASADKTIKLWDLNTAKCAQSYSYHTDQVCALAWHPQKDTMLLSGSYDRTVVCTDMRTPAVNQPRWGVESDVEDIRWDPHDDNYFYVSTEAGVVHFHDSRSVSPSPAASNPVWKLQAHDKAVSTFDVSPVIPGFFATGSVDKTVKLWNMRSSSGGPAMVVSRQPGIGEIFSTRFAPDAEVGFRLAVAGSKGVVTVWDTSTNLGVRTAFCEGMALNPIAGGAEDRVVCLNGSSSGSEDEESEGEQDEYPGR